jgi:uncharacterized protein
VVALVVGLYYYPVKGCAGTPVRDGELTLAGLRHDRTFMVVNRAGRFRTQREAPLLASIRPTMDSDGETLTLQAPGAGTVTVEVDTRSARREVDLFGTTYPAIDQGDLAAEWVSGVLGEHARLVRVPPEHARVTRGPIPGTAGFADGCSVHLMSLSSLAALNERIAERGGAPVPMERFRPNVVVDGWPAHQEDRVRRVTVGNTEWGYAKLAIRCAVTLVDQGSGAKVGPEPLRTLATYRRAREGGVAFGANFAVLRPGKLSVGDEPVVTEWGGSEL